MSWLPRLQIALFAIVIVGMLFLIFGYWESGWSSPAYLAWGMVISVGGFLLNLIFSGVTAIFQPRLRKVSIWIAVVSLVMLLGLLIALAWVGAGERLSLFLDRFQTVRLSSLPTQPLSAYNGKEGTYSVGAFFIGKEEMPTAKKSDWMAFPLTLYVDENQLRLSTGGKSFTFGPLLETTRDDVGRLLFAFAPEPEDKVSFTLERSLLSWRTPFEISLTGGPVASWRRHLTYRLLWRKRSGARLEMVWCYRQDFIPGEGWKQVWPNAIAGLIRVGIRP